MRDHLILFCATGAYAGKIPKAPGTFGTLAGLPLAALLALCPMIWALPVLLIFIGLAMLNAQAAARIMGQKDPGAIVIDEIAGIMVALCAIPISPVTLIAAFVLFRLLDITKPFPVGYIDRHLTGGPGIVLDDVAAGLITNILLHAGLWFFAGRIF